MPDWKKGYRVKSAAQKENMMRAIEAIRHWMAQLVGSIAHEVALGICHVIVVNLTRTTSTGTGFQEKWTRSSLIWIDGRSKTQGIKTSMMER
eukprot:4194976-Amphidinium_carterae.2